ncbi:RNA polymerase sigma factor [Paludisphaera mucosa]|uniref:Sigma-70 family RNA polymerase sigma factor n=1 Tax=Paludisphaera mucosa TaxID=3030827 RepID=A0ABT6F976_9BACT|nr:sigma-70 family RNA polymerase sigma factor [Paludisphaera mucosa]MDG3004140.1 sigma-70 family RNA polymerase sigma factor [Paludisphaera mucosa]
MADRLARGDPEAFARLYEAVGDRLHHYLVARLGASADADDVLQETFVRLVRNRQGWRGVENTVSFAFTVARNEANRWLDARRRRGATIVAATARGLFAEADSDDLEARETAEAIARALASLDDEDREIVELKTYAGLTFREIGAILGRPLTTVAMRHRAALDRMRTHLVRERR